MPAKAAGRPIAATDGEMLLRFTRHGDQGAFAQLVEAHGPLVWSVCRQVLHHQADMEDAFQATFMILARRAGDIRASDSAAGWLYRVAHRTSVALARKNKSRPEEPLNGHDFASGDDDPLEMVHRQHAVTVLVEELRTLPTRYQEPLVLCYLEGHTRSRVAEMLDLTTATIKGRLARGKRMLRHRLARRGVALSVAAGIAAATVETAKASAAEATLTASTTAAASEFVTKGFVTSGGGASPTAVSLAQQGVSVMFYTALAKPALSVAAIVAMGLVAAAAKDDRPQQSRVPSSGVSLVASADAGQATNPLVATEVEVEVTKRPSDDAGLEPAGLDPDDQITGPTQPPTNVDVQPPSVPESPERPTTFPPKPAAPAAGSKQQSVQVEIATIDGSDEDILVFRGDQDAVKRIQGRMIKMFDKPPTPTAPPLLAAESRPRQVDPPDVDHDIRVPDINVTAPVQPNFAWNQSGDDQPSVQELELERLYWETRMEGLEIKSMLLERKHKQIETLAKSDPKAVSDQELEKAGELMSESYLMRADSYQAKAKMLAMDRKIERRKKALNVPTRISTPSYAVPPPQTNNTQPRYAADYSQPRYAPQPDPVYRDPNAPTPAQLTPRYGVHTTPAVPTPHLQWLSDFDEARKVSEQMGRRILVHNAMPYSQENARFREVIDGSPNIQLYVHQHYVPLRINPYTKSETLEQLRVDRVPPMGVFAADGRLLKELTLPQQPTELLLELRSVAEGDSSGQAIPNRTAKKPRYQRAEPAAPVDPEDMLLPHENVRVTITQQRPREGKWVVITTVNHQGFIAISNVGFGKENLGQVPIGGMGPDGAAKVVLSVLADYYGEFFKSMGFDVKVERNRDTGETEEAAHDGGPQSKPPTEAPAARPVYPASNPYESDKPHGKITWTADYDPTAATDTSELSKLKKELESLRKENETLKKQTRDLPTLDPGPPSPAE